LVEYGDGVDSRRAVPDRVVHRDQTVQLHRFLDALQGLEDGDVQPLGHPSVEPLVEVADVEGVVLGRTETFAQNDKSVKRQVQLEESRPFGQRLAGVGLRGGETGEGQLLQGLADVADVGFSQSGDFRLVEGVQGLGVLEVDDSEKRDLMMCRILKTESFVIILELKNIHVGICAMTCAYFHK
jgi:hypothetical protein